VAAALQLDAHVRHLREPFVQLVEEGRVDDELLLAVDVAAHELPQLAGGRRGRAALELHRRVQRLEQRQRPDVAEEDDASRRARAHRAFHDAREILRRGEVLGDRVQDDGVERALGKAVEVVRRAVQQRHLRQSAELRARGLDAVERRLREIRRDVLVAVRRDAEEHEPRSAAELEHAPRAHREDARDGRVEPFAHLARGNRLARVAAVPAGDVERRIGRAGAVVDLAPDGAPVVDVLVLRLGEVAVAPRDDVRDERLLARRLLARDGDRLLHVRMRSERRLDLAELDPEAAHLHLVVEAPEELDPAVVAVADEVASLVQPRAGGVVERVRDEPLGDEVRPASVAAREASAADVELAGYADRHRPQARIEDVERRVRGRPPDRDRLTLAHAVEAGVDRRLGRAVAVPELDATIGERVRERGQQRLAAAEALQAGAPAPAGVDEHAPRRRRCLQHRRARPVEQRRELVRIRRRRRRRDHDARARDERQVQLDAGDVERERGHADEDVLGAEARPLAHRREQVDEPAVRNLDALRPAGRAGRVHDVDELLRVELDAQRARGQRVDLRAVAVEANDLRGVRRQTLEQRLLSHEHGRLRVLQHQRLALGGVCGVDRHVRGARLQDPVDAGDGVQLLVEVQPDAVSPPDTQVSQHMRERVRARVQLPVCLLPIAAAHGDALTVRPRRTLEQPVENGLAQRPRCRATMLRCISEVPEWIRVAIASRTSRSSSYSVM
jgi:hypothetical protein